MNCNLTINGREVVVEAGATVMTAAREFGVEIPNLCFLEAHEAFGSCALCVVEERQSGQLLISCTARAEDGMDICTDSASVRQARRTALELLLSEHVGDCEAPCRLACPAGFDIAALMELLAVDDLVGAAAMVEDGLPMAAILCGSCKAPCEAACRRAKLDRPISIRGSILRLLESERPPVAKVRDSSGKSVAIAGAGPVGLATAVHLSEKGHACTVYEATARPGGRLLDEADEAAVIAELQRIEKRGVTIVVDAAVGRPSWQELQSTFDAVVVTWGANPEIPSNAIDLENPEPGVFVGGEAVRPMRTLARTGTEARQLAAAVDGYLRGDVSRNRKRRFQSRIGRLDPAELESLKSSVSSETGEMKPVSISADAERCLQCGCFERRSCALRHYAEQYEVNVRRFRHEGRTKVQRRAQGAVVHEPGKCVRCSRCVRLSGMSQAMPGMTVIGRGYDIRIDTPFGEHIDDALEGVVNLCVENCPTGALVKRSVGKRQRRRK
ncbi:MAG: NAD(P)-binding protein [bacterium]|nr:NAD(P)-binding protein [bacterium]